MEVVGYICLSPSLLFEAPLSPLDPEFDKFCPKIMMKYYVFVQQQLDNYEPNKNLAIVS